mgnify:FL=1
MKHKIWNIDAAQVPDDVYHYVADNISVDWKKLGRQLGISKPHLKNIAHENYHNVCEQSTALLNEWKEKTGEKATVGVLRKALDEIGKKNLSEKVRGMNISGSFYQLHSSTLSTKSKCYRSNY